MLDGRPDLGSSRVSFCFVVAALGRPTLTREPARFPPVGPPSDVRLWTALRPVCQFDRRRGFVPAAGSRTASPAPPSPAPAFRSSTRDSPRSRARTDRISSPASPPGDYQCLIEKDGYLPLVTRVRAAGAAREIVVSAALEILRSEITVVAKEAERPETIASSRLSLTGTEVRKLPGTFEDVSRALQSVPGVASAGDFRNDLIVRGGSPAENLFMLEWIQLPGLSHFGSQNSSGGGYFGLLDSRLIKTIDFYSGGFPAMYGDKLSSVTRVALREGDRNRFSGSAYFSLLGLSGSAEGPLFGGKGSWLATVRKDYFFAVPKDMTLELTVMPELFDAQAKAVVDLSKRLQLSVLGLAGSDAIRIEEADEPPAQRMTIDFNDHTTWAGRPSSGSSADRASPISPSPGRTAATSTRNGTTAWSATRRDRRRRKRARGRTSRSSPGRSPGHGRVVLPPDRGRRPHLFPRRVRDDRPDGLLVHEEEHRPRPGLEQVGGLSPDVLLR